MEIITDLNFKWNDTAVCIGKFDGIHRGHRLLLKEAARSGLKTVMITFLFPDNKGIYSREEKEYLAEKLAVDYMVMIPVTGDFMKMTAESFVCDVLYKRCGARKVVVGEDFCFGYRRGGNACFLKEEGKRYGMDVCVLKKVRQDGEVISSTRIRNLLKDGRIEEANRLLETPYFVKGTVHAGNRIGRTISVPTANITPSGEKELPPHGVYAVKVFLDGIFYDAVANLGVKPTVPGENPVGLEVWLFDFEGDLYNREIVVYFYRFQRPEQKFSDMAALKKQIEEDTKKARRYLIHQP